MCTHIIEIAEIRMDGLQSDFIPSSTKEQARQQEALILGEAQVLTRSHSAEVFLFITMFYWKERERTNLFSQPFGLGTVATRTILVGCGAHPSC